MIESKTYDEWKEEGYQVRKGEKAIGKDLNGDALFSEDQVYDPDDTDEEPQELYFEG